MEGKSLTTLRPGAIWAGRGKHWDTDLLPEKYSPRSIASRWRSKQLVAATRDRPTIRYCFTLRLVALHVVQPNLDWSVFERVRES